MIVNRWFIMLVVFSLSMASFLSPLARACAQRLTPQKLETETAQVLYVTVPATNDYSIIPVVSDSLERLPQLVEKVRPVALAAINGGYFDPANKMTTSYVIGGGFLLANPVDNRHFVENPALYDFLPDMLNRTEFRVLDCAGQRRYDIAHHRDKVKSHCELLHSLQAGPNLMTPKAARDEAFVRFKEDVLVADPIGFNRKNARSAIGIDPYGNVIIAMASMKPDMPDNKSGVTLPEMTQIMLKLGANKALSLDGGSSSSMWVNGETYYGKLSGSNQPIRRPIKSALIVIRDVPESEVEAHEGN